MDQEFTITEEHKTLYERRFKLAGIDINSLGTKDAFDEALSITEGALDGQLSELAAELKDPTFKRAVTAALLNDDATFERAYRQCETRSKLGLVEIKEN